jgi:hypothetical protein
VDHQFRSRHRLLQHFAIKQVCLMKGEGGMKAGGFEEASLSGGEIIESHHPVPGRKQSIDHVAADKSCRAGNEYAQSSLPLRDGNRAQMFKESPLASVRR